MAIGMTQRCAGARSGAYSVLRLHAGSRDRRQPIARHAAASRPIPPLRKSSPVLTGDRFIETKQDLFLS